MTASSTEAEVKRSQALGAAVDLGYGAVVASDPATVRWLLCGRGRPVSVTAPEADYTVVLAGGRGTVLFPDIEASRVSADERFEVAGVRAGSIRLA